MSESLYVDKFYVAQTEYEDIIFGGQLRDGMTVLLADDLLRADMDNVRNKYDQARADECNRWCEVTQLQTIASDYGPLVKFVGRYPDGSLRVRKYAASYGWIIKREL